MHLDEMMTIYLYPLQNTRVKSVSVLMNSDLLQKMIKNKNKTMDILEIRLDPT